jgi:outer membrane receptor protein involved in Fe transport
VERVAVGQLKLLFACAVLFFPTDLATAQARVGSVQLFTLDQTGAAVPNAEITIEQDRVTRKKAVSGPRGEFTFHHLPYGSYKVSIAAAGFLPVTQMIAISSGVPIELKIILQPGMKAEITVVGSGDQDSSRGTVFVLGGESLQRVAGDTGAGLRKVLKTIPGFVAEDNGLLHVRGVDDGMLYVIDGIPYPDRVDNFSASIFPMEQIESVQVIMGNIPPEFGGRSGGVAILDSRSGMDVPMTMTAAVGAGSFAQTSAGLAVQGHFRSRLGLFGRIETGRSERFLDPVSAANLHNTGGSLSGNLRLEWKARARDLLSLRVEGRGAKFDVPNDEEQETAGQDHRQKLTDNLFHVSWQHVLSPMAVLDVNVFRHGNAGELDGEGSGIPLEIFATRSHRRTGFVSAVSGLIGGNVVKAGVEFAHLSPRESLRFHVTDPISAEEHEISLAAQQFTAAQPFLFADQRDDSSWGAYVQTNVPIFKRLTLNLGVRYDRISLPTVEDAWSPRVGVAFLAWSGTTFRGSYNRFFMPPQVENILLANSEQARQLSPFAGTGIGGADVLPERSSAYELGVEQRVGKLFTADVAAWWRRFEDVADPNVFFNTTIIIPNSVDSGRAHGVDVRLETTPGERWLGYVSYSNQNVVQYGPIRGGLFLTDDFISIGPGTRFTPDHDQRNTAAFGVSFDSGWHGTWVSFTGHYQSGVPLEVEDSRLLELMNAPGAELVNFAARRVKPWTTFDVAAGMKWSRGAVAVEPRLELLNLLDRSYVYNFGSPFSGTHFGSPRALQASLRIHFQREP